MLRFLYVFACGGARCIAIFVSRRMNHPARNLGTGPAILRFFESRKVKASWLENPGLK
jgi:hypothetical protein